ncbi:MAG: hypothetical protein A2033_14440 [Bacteroidetes bacterium GWA2_31_9]|nr:MAG: hypothetical protein A2033_14440 [Bacteroidetes bacterium GWA2_31_9]
MIEKSIILGLILKIANSINPDKIFLIGSYASGNANNDSDIDLLVIKETKEPKYKRSIEIQRLLIGTKLPVDVVVYTNEEFEKEKNKNYSFVNVAIQDAQLMYERK